MKAALHVTSMALLVSTMFLPACGGADDTADPPPACVSNLNTSCTPLDSPQVYSTLYSKIIQQNCTAGTSCHSTDGAMGGLVLANADDTYDALLGTKGGPKRVVPGDPACSPLMVRFTSHDPNYVMPRGSPLSDGQLCDFVKWIEQGAQKN